MLTCHLKRFNKYMQKISKPIEFEETLDIGQYMNNSIDKKRHESCKYQLYAVAVHRGSDLYGGHYYAYVRGLDGNWYLANDESVRQVPASRLMQEHAYVLLYQRVNTKPIERPKEETAVAESQAAAKSAQDARTEGRLVIAELFSKKAKAKAAEREREKEKEHSSNGQRKEPAAIAPPPEPMAAVPTTKPKSPDTSTPRSAGERSLIIPNSKRGKLVKISKSIYAIKKRMRPENGEEAAMRVKQKYFHAEGEVEEWEERKLPEHWDPRLRLVAKEAREAQRRTRDYYDVKYDAGKCKKLKDKAKEKIKTGLARQLDMVQAQRKVLAF